MKKQSICSLFMASLMTLLPVAANAQAELDVTWDKPEEYRDVKPTGSTRTKFRNHVFSELEEYLLERLLVKLPDGYKLTMTVTDLDLAGQVWPGMMVGLNSSGDVRLIKQMDIPRITFSYQLTGADGEVIRQGDENIKDMSFMDRSTMIPNSQNFRYEKAMLKRWFEEQFEQYFIEN